MIMVYILQEVPKEIGVHRLPGICCCVLNGLSDTSQVMPCGSSDSTMRRQKSSWIEKKSHEKRATLLYIMMKIGYNPN